jgi:hypothetical protein
MSALSWIGIRDLVIFEVWEGAFSFFPCARASRASRDLELNIRRRAARSVFLAAGASISIVHAPSPSPRAPLPSVQGAAPSSEAARRASRTQAFPSLRAANSRCVCAAAGARARGGARAPLRVNH